MSLRSRAGHDHSFLSSQAVPEGVRAFVQLVWSMRSGLTRSTSCRCLLVPVSIFFGGVLCIQLES
jgi:hypothetical protein